MKTQGTAGLLRFGAARALTRDMIPGRYTEIHVYDSEWPPTVG